MPDEVDFHLRYASKASTCCARGVKLLADSSLIPVKI